MDQPRDWSPQDLEIDAATARTVFRDERLLEPLEQYGVAFEHYVPVVRQLLSRLDEIADDATAAKAMAAIAADVDARTALRYLTAPPVSEDDLRVLADTPFTRSAMLAGGGRAVSLRDTIFRIIDGFRFPWIADRRNATDDELERAVLATAVLLATRKVETSRRSEANKRQESLVVDALVVAGFKQVPARDIPQPDAAPTPGTFCGESRFGTTKADFVVRLHDQRILAIECKVSNSAVNSYKRVNHEAANKARTWLNDFGHRTTVPAAVLAGVFKPANLITAQAAGLSLFWAHRLSDLTAFVREAI